MIWSGTICGTGDSSPPENSPLLQIHGASKTKRALWARFLEKILDLLFPIYCAGCQTEGIHCCEWCFVKIKKQKSPLYIASAHEYESSQIHSLFAAAPFYEHSVLATLLHRFKYDGAREVAQILVSIFSQELIGELKRIPRKIFIPIPLHKRRESSRGFNQSVLLACELQKIVGGTVLSLIRRSRYTKPQALLSKIERHENIKNAFKISDPLLMHSKNQANTQNEPPIYFLVDDVYTTGSTMNECARALKKLGIEKVNGIVIGRA